MEKLKTFLRKKFPGAEISRRIMELSAESKSKYDKVKRWFNGSPKFIGSFDLSSFDLFLADADTKKILDLIEEFYLNNKYFVSENKFKGDVDDVFNGDMAFQNQEETLFVSVTRLRLVYNILIVKLGKLIDYDIKKRI